MTVSSSLSQPKHSILWYRRILEQGVRAGGTGPEGFQTEGYGYPAGYLVYEFDPHTLCQFRGELTSVANSLAGFADVEVKGNFSDAPLNAEHTDMIFVATKPAG